MLTVLYRADGASLRDILKLLHSLGYPKAAHIQEKNKNDLRSILKKEVKTYQTKFVVTLAIQMPILVLLWIVPYRMPGFLTDYDIVNGNTLYLFMLLFFSSLI